MQLPGTASSSLQLESPTCSLNSRSLSSSGRSPFQSSITNVAQFPVRRYRGRNEVKAQPASLRVETGVRTVHRDMLPESIVRSTEPALLAEPPVHFEDLEQFYHVLNLSVQLSTPPPRSSQTPGGGDDDKNEFYANVGNAIRTLRVEIPLLFQQDFTCKSPSLICHIKYPSSKFICCLNCVGYSAMSLFLCH